MHAYACTVGVHFTYNSGNAATRSSTNYENILFWYMRKMKEEKRNNLHHTSRSSILLLRRFKVRLNFCASVNSRVVIDQW